MSTDLLKRAVEIVGSQAKLAAAIGTTQQNIQYRIATGGLTPAEWCRPIEDATAGQITKHELRPDLWDAPERAA